MPGQEIVDSLRIRRDDLTEENTWPRLSCSGAHQVVFEGTMLQFGNRRDGVVAHNWEIGSFDGQHKLVFNRQQGALELHERGEIRFLTGGPTPSEKLRILPNGNVGIGTAAPTQKLQVSGNAVVNNVFLGDVGHTAVWAGFSHGNQIGPLSYALLQSQDGLYTLINKKSGGGHIGFRVDNNDKVTISDNGDLTVRGALSFPHTGGGLATLSAGKYNNESSFQNNNVKLIMGSSGVFTQVGQLSYEFAIGELFTFRSGGLGNFVFRTNFIKRFSINQNGDLYCAGSKAGYVVDHFVNRVGDAVEQGDVVVISRHESSIFSGTDNNIPLPEVDLAEKAYDTRVCGIVASAVSEPDLPFVEAPPEAYALSEAGLPPPGDVAEAEEGAPYEHPLKPFAAPASEDADRKRVQDQQMGTMVTLGAYAHCKVDADIAPIEAGDLLTTSPTRGHAQKALDPSQAVGAIIGKALGSLASGKGKIPVLVMLQ